MSRVQCSGDGEAQLDIEGQGHSKLCMLLEEFCNPNEMILEASGVFGGEKRRRF